MGNLFFSTLIMMGLTFAIGFVVAAVIWLIAYWAESYEFYNAHHEELKRLARLRKAQQPGRLMMGWGFSSLRKGDYDYALGSYYQGKSGGVSDPADSDLFYHETSLGVSDLGLMDFYYPSNAKISILEHQKQEEEERIKTENTPSKKNKK